MIKLSELANRTLLLFHSGVLTFGGTGLPRMSTFSCTTSHNFRAVKVPIHIRADALIAAAEYSSVLLTTSS